MPSKQVRRHKKRINETVKSARKLAKEFGVIVPARTNLCAAIDMLVGIPDLESDPTFHAVVSDLLDLSDSNIGTLLGFNK